MRKVNSLPETYSRKNPNVDQEQRAIPGAVREIAKISFEGNIIPHSWYQKITFESGKPDLPAITILSELIYWYRPIKELTATGKPYLRKRFYSDRFECSAAYFANKFGFTKTQARKAIQRLVDLHLIDREYRTVIRNDIVHNNVMAIEPVVENIIEITHPGAMLVLIGKNDVLPLTADGDPLPLEASPPSPETLTLSPVGDTPKTADRTLSSAGYTLLPAGEESKITTKTTTEITTTTANTGGVADVKVATGDHSNGGGSSGNRLIFDLALASWTPARRHQAEKTLEKLDPETAQAVLDELNESIAAGKVKQPLPWLRKVAERAWLGEFASTNEIAERRAAQQRRQADAALEALAKPSQLWKDHVKDLKTQFNESDFNQNIVPLRGLERGEVLVLQAPNQFVKDWVQQHLKEIRDVIGAYVDYTPKIRVNIG